MKRELKGFDPIVSDFSGQNWDDLALSLLLESIRLKPRMMRTVDGSGHVSGPISGRDSGNVYVLNPTPTIHDSRMGESLARERAREEVRQETPRANLSHSDLQNADLSHADLRGVNLSRANLFAARLDHANLEQADLRGADLRSTHLAAAKLNETRLYGAIFDQWTALPFDKETAVLKGMVYMEITAEQ